MPVTFTKTKLPFGWLGNMAGHPLNYQGKIWRTPEHLFQALRFSDEAIQDEIRLERSPMSAKFAAKRHATEMSVAPMSAQDLANMEIVLRLKLEQHPALKNELLATGDNIIIEDVTKRTSGGRHTFWGMSNATGDWIGDNALGNLWMKLREELRNAAGPGSSIASDPDHHVRGSWANEEASTIPT